MRGKAFGNLYRLNISRITPAYAGKRGFGLFPNLYI